MFALRKRPASNISMQTGGQDPPISIETFQKNIREDWFASPAVFALKALTTKLSLPEHIKDTCALRGVLVCQALKLFPTLKTCPRNAKHKVKLEEYAGRFQWTCSVRGHNCFRGSLCPVGLLSHVRVQAWMPFLYFVNCMRLNVRWTKLMVDITALFGAYAHNTLRRWRSLYQDALEVYLQKHDLLMLGASRGDVFVFDETSMGNVGGISKVATVKETHHKPRKLQRSRIIKHLPAQTLHRPAACKRPATIYKRPSSVMKSVYNKGIAGTSKDQRTGRWLFAAVLVGNKSVRYTHQNGKKKFTFRIMDLPKNAPDGKPRGIKAMKAAIQSCISPKAFVVHDKWKASSPALAQLGFKAAPPVNHSRGWRDRATGFHSNDIESEFSRLKRAVRERYGRLSFQSQGQEDDTAEAIDAGDLFEYAFKVNVGDSFFDCLKALQVRSPC